MKDFSIYLEAGASHDLTYTGRAYHIQEASAPVRLSFDSGDSVTREKTQGGLTRPFTRVRLESSVAQRVTVSLGETPVADGRLELSGQTIDVETKVPAVLRSPLDVEIPDLGAVLLAAGNLNRKSVLIAVPSLSDYAIRVGGSDVDASRGLIVEAGATIELNTTAAVYGVAIGGNVSVSVLEQGNF